MMRTYMLIILLALSACGGGSKNQPTDDVQHTTEPTSDDESAAATATTDAPANGDVAITDPAGWTRNTDREDRFTMRYYTSDDGAVIIVSKFPYKAGVEATEAMDGYDTLLGLGTPTQERAERTIGAHDGWFAEYATSDGSGGQVLVFYRPVTDTAFYSFKLQTPAEQRPTYEPVLMDLIEGTSIP